MQYSNGFITLNRSLLEWKWHDDPVVMTLWVHLLLMANWTEKEWHKIKIPRGSMMTSAGALAKRTGLTEKQVRRGLECLKQTGEITTQRASKGQIISVEKYNIYQCQGETQGNQKDNQRDNQRAIKGQQLNNINKVKNKKDILSGKPDTAPKKGRALTDTCTVVVKHLNELTGSRYKPSAKYLKVLIGARLADGYTQDDFITVIDRQVAKWGKDPKMAEYLRPKTLFTPANFDSYLNAPVTPEELKKEKAKEQQAHDKAQFKIEQAKLQRLAEYLNNDPDNRELLQAYREQKSKVDWLEGRLK